MQGGQDALERVPLAKGSPGYRIRLCCALPEGTKAVEKPEGRKARLEKEDYFFFDVDGNGKWNDLGVDGWARHKMPLLLPGASQRYAAVDGPTPPRRP